MDFDEKKIDEAVLAMLYLTLHDVTEDRGRAWKGLDWDALNRLHARNLISDPRSRAKSVYLTTEAIDTAKQASEKLFSLKSQ